MSLAGRLRNSILVLTDNSMTPTLRKMKVSKEEQGQLLTRQINNSVAKVQQKEKEGFNIHNLQLSRQGTL